MTVKVDYIDAAKKQNQRDEENANLRKEQIKTETAQKNQQIEEAGRLSISELGGKYRSVYDENAVRQYIGERRVAENMANLGLTDSGLNRTQQTALQVSRGNADYNTRLQYEAAVRSIEQSVRDEISANNIALTNQIATIDQKLAADSADRLYNAELDQMEYDAEQQAKAEKEAKEAAEKAEKEAKEAAEKAEKEAEEEKELAETERDDLITSITNAVKYSKQSGIDTFEVAKSVKDFMIRYNLTQAEAEFILINAGISPLRLKDDYFENAIKERDRWQAIKTGIEDYGDAKSNGLSFDITSAFKTALDDYNVEKYGADKLLPLLVQEGFLDYNDVTRIEYFYNSYIGSNPAEKTRIYGKDKILRFANALYTQGMASELAAQFMIALYEYHNN